MAIFKPLGRAVSIDEPQWEFAVDWRVKTSLSAKISMPYVSGMAGHSSSLLLVSTCATPSDAVREFIQHSTLHAAIANNWSVSQTTKALNNLHRDMLKALFSCPVTLGVELADSLPFDMDFLRPLTSERCQLFVHRDVYGLALCAPAQLSAVECFTEVVSTMLHHLASHR